MRRGQAKNYDRLPPVLFINDPEENMPVANSSNPLFQPLKLWNL
jgi:hypothetical protein